MPDIGDDRENHQVNFLKGSYADLCNFRKAYGYKDNGQAIAALLDTYQEVLKLHKKYEDEQAVTAAKQREIEDYEQLLIRESGLSQAAYSVIQQLIEEEGISQEDLEAACQILRVAGVSLPELVELLAKFGGMREMMANLTQAIEQLEAERQAILERKAKQCKETTLARVEMERLQGEQEKARKQIEVALQFAGVVTKAYEGINVILGDVIGKVLAGGYSVMDLPAEVMDVLIGVLLMLRIDMHGDRGITLPPHPVLHRLAKFQVDLSEIPRLLAPPEYYKEFEASLSLTGGGNGESHMEDGPGFVEAPGV